MRAACCDIAILLALVGGVMVAGPARAIEEERLFTIAVPGVEDETTGSIDRSLAAQGLPLSDEQRGLIFLGVINLPDVPTADEAEPESEVVLPASVLPASFDLHELPAMVTRRVPQLRGLKFVKFYDRILVVRPADRVVVSDIPRYRLLP